MTQRQVIIIFNKRKVHLTWFGYNFFVGLPLLLTSFCSLVSRTSNPSSRKVFLSRKGHANNYFQLKIVIYQLKIVNRTLSEILRHGETYFHIGEFRKQNRLHLLPTHCTSMYQHISIPKLIRTRLLSFKNCMLKLTYYPKYKTQHQE